MKIHPLLLLCAVCALISTLAYVGLVYAESELDPLHVRLEQSPRWYEDANEPDQDRAQRISEIVEAARVLAHDATCNDGALSGCVRVVRLSATEYAGLLLTAAYWETRLSQRIQAGQCKPNECDHGRARGLGQVQLTSGIPRELWERVDTFGQVAAIDWVMRRATRCGKVEKAFNFYALGSCDRWHRQSEDRRHWWSRLVRGL